MIVRTYIEDNKLDHWIREYGVNKLARELGVGPSYLSRCINNKRTMSEELYAEIGKIYNAIEKEEKGPDVFNSY